MNYKVVTACGIALIGLGCQVDIKPDKEAQRQAEQYGSVAKEAAKAAGSKAMEEAGKAAGDMGKTAQKATRQALNTGAIKAALANRGDLDTSQVEVLTDNRTVTLRGSAISTAQRSEIEIVARAVAGPEFTLQNDIKVAGE